MATLFTKAFCLFSFESYGQGLEGLQKLPPSPAVEVIELLHRGHQTELLFFCDHNVLKSLDSIETKAKEVFEKPHPDLIKMFLHLTNNPLQDYLVVCESDELAALLKAAQCLFELGLVPVDFQYLRSARGSGFILFTGPHAAIDLSGLDRSIRVSVIQKPGEQVRNYFNLQNS